MIAAAAKLNRTSTGLAVLLVALNLEWLASSVSLLEVGLLRDELWKVPFATALALLLLFAAVNGVVGLIQCLAAPVRTGARVARDAALLLTAAALAGSVAHLPTMLRPFAPQVGGPFFAYENLLPPLAALALWCGNVAALGFLHGLARSIDQERLAARALRVGQIAAALLALAVGVFCGGNLLGLIGGAVLLWLGGLAWLFLYGFLLIQLRDAVQHAAQLRGRDDQRRAEE
jgi:hypothetical protein